MRFSIRNLFKRHSAGAAERLLERGIAAEASGAAAEAMQCYRQAIEADPHCAAAHCNLGLLYLAAGRVAEAEAALRAALQAREDFPEAWVALADALESQGRDAAALEALERAIALRDGYEGALMNAAVLLQKMRRLDAAATRYRQVLELAPDAAALHNNLANVLQALGRLGEAEASCRRALELDPGLPEAHFNLGNILQGLGRATESEESLRRALELRPGYREAYTGLGNALRDQGRVDAAQASFRAALELDAGDRDARDNLLLSLNYTDRHTRAEVYAEHLEWARRHVPPEGARQPRANIPDPGRRLRIGYVSGDFRRHSVAYFIEPVLARHDRSSFEVTCYSNVALPDQMTAHLMRLADHAREISGLGDAEAAQLVRTDGIDILVDLAGHTAGHRLGVFALKPAPVQATYLGYPNTTGLAAVDWRITDVHADPPGDGDEFHSERLLRLPKTFLCFQPPAEAPEVQPPPSLKNGFVTFGSFNVLPKVTPEVIRAWSLLLGRVPGSRLLLKALGLGDAGSRAQMLAAFARHGVAADRVTVLPLEGSLRDHLARYHEMDIALDPFPFNGTTTTLEALWMGVPVVAIAGDRHSARVGSSILANAGLRELVARDADEYVALAAALAADGARLAALRLAMRDRVAASPLRDPAGFVRDLEGAYREVWARWCAATPG
ncbi:MAG: tetratricopeptide repeat protein [Proteobacteria bacterium]|nr:tetratricopeptide repeat protein [Pseudomonadota bacterium]